MTDPEATDPAATATADPRLRTLFDALGPTRAEREELYKWFHRHPETAFTEYETSRRIGEELSALGLSPVSVGTTGKVAVLANGEGPVVMMRADFDALPCAEESGKDYSADPQLGRMHACGHDLHTTALLGAVRALVENLDAWRGTFIALFQPAEEIGQGASEMVAAGLTEKVPHPDVVLGQHVFSTLPGGAVGARRGPALSTTTQLRVVIHGRGGHGSMPHTTIDPVVIAGAVIGRIQTIVSRELEPGTFGVVTVGSVHAGDAPNTVADSATLRLSTRAYDEDVDARLLASVERIVRAECAAAGAEREPEFTVEGRGPLTTNDVAVTDAVMGSFRSAFGEEGVHAPGRWTGSEDFSNIPRAFGAPYCFWALGGFSDWENAPSNHSPQFAPDLQPSLDRGTEAILAAAAPWLIR
ncbi:amidohydrolase [Corynebacterium frankenforstense]|uniref:amidohydrolase n=1 Tax=Corynebacterium frankenforstense TaxID=1230998 RepID=UPI0026A0EE02